MSFRLDRPEAATWRHYGEPLSSRNNCLGKQITSSEALVQMNRTKRTDLIDSKTTFHKLISLVALTNLLLVLLTGSNQVHCFSGSNAPFKTSFLSSSDYSGRRNGALKSFPMVTIETMNPSSSDSLLLAEDALEANSFEDQSRMLLGGSELVFLRTNEPPSNPTLNSNGASTTRQPQQSASTILKQPTSSTPSSYKQTTTTPAPTSISTTTSTTSTTASPALAITTIASANSTVPIGVAITTTAAPTTAQSTSSIATINSTSSIAPDSTSTSSSDSSFDEVASTTSAPPTVGNSSTPSVAVGPTDRETRDTPTSKVSSSAELSTTSVPPSSSPPESTTIPPQSKPTTTIVIERETNASNLSTLDFSSKELSASSELKVEDKEVPVKKTKQLQSTDGKENSDTEPQSQSSSVANSTIEGSRPTICFPSKANCNFLIASVPIVDHQGGNGSRLVNEFVFMPQDTPLTFEEGAYPSRGSSLNTKSSELPVEHRGLDADDDSTNLSDDYISGPPNSDLPTKVEATSVNQQTSSQKDIVKQYAAQSNLQATAEKKQIDRHAETRGDINYLPNKPDAFESSHISKSKQGSPPVPTLVSSAESITHARASSTYSPSVSTSRTTSTNVTTSTTTIAPSTSNIGDIGYSKKPNVVVEVSTGSDGSNSSVMQLLKANVKLGGSKQTSSSSSTTTTTTTTTSTTTTSTTAKPITARPNQKLMRLNEQKQSLDAKPTPFVQTRPTPTSRKPRISRLDWARNDQFDNARQSKQLVSNEFRQRSRSSSNRNHLLGTNFSPLVNGGDEEEARILTRYSIPSQLSRLSSAEIGARTKQVEVEKTGALQGRVEIQAGRHAEEKPERFTRSKLQSQVRSQKMIVEQPAREQVKQNAAAFSTAASASGSTSTESNPLNPTSSRSSSESRWADKWQQPKEPGHELLLADPEQVTAAVGLANQKEALREPATSQAPTPSSTEEPRARRENVQPTETSRVVTTTIFGTIDPIQAKKENLELINEVLTLISSTASAGTQHSNRTDLTKSEIVERGTASPSNSGLIFSSSTSSTTSSYLPDNEGLQPEAGQRLSSQIGSRKRMAGGQLHGNTYSKPKQVQAAARLAITPVDTIAAVAVASKTQQQQQKPQVASLSARATSKGDMDELVGNTDDQLAQDTLHHQPVQIENSKQTSPGNTRREVSRNDEIKRTANVKRRSESASDEQSHANQDESQGGAAGQSNVLPGRPGVDYPVHWQVPKTSFDCRNYDQTGFFADPESDCQAYHSCHKGRGGQHTFLCPNGTLFSQELLTCDWWYNVECSAVKLQVANVGGNNLESSALGDLERPSSSNSYLRSS